MAKLENVKVLDKSNGVVSRIQYNGKVYVRVTDGANTGDLVLVENEDDAEWICGVESGAFYELYEEDEYGYLVFSDDDDVERVYSSWSNELILFRAIEISDKNIEKRVAELERRLSAIERQSERLKVGNTLLGRKPGEFKKGDIVRVIDSCGGPLIKGGLYEISGHEGNVGYVTLDGINRLAEFELVAPVESRVDLD